MPTNGNPSTGWSSGLTRRGCTGCFGEGTSGPALSPGRRKRRAAPQETTPPFVFFPGRVPPAADPRPTFSTVRSGERELQRIPFAQFQRARAFGHHRIGFGEAPGFLGGFGAVDDHAAFSIH